MKMRIQESSISSIILWQHYLSLRQKGDAFCAAFIRAFIKTEDVSN